MTDRTQEAIRADIVAAEQEAAAAQKRKRDLQTELGAALVRDAPGHEWLGRNVIQPPEFTRSKSARGVLKTNEHFHTFFTGGRSVAPGELYVISHSGKTNYAWRGGNGWELEK